MSVKRSFTDASADVDTFARLRMKDNPDLTYVEAVQGVLASNDDLARSYRAKPEPEPEDMSKFAKASSYNEAVDALNVQAENLSMNLGIPYELSFKRILTLDRNRLLARKYLEGPTKRERQAR